MHFNDVINLHRIKYIEEGLTNKEWETLTLEAIAGKAGFNNRITFLSAFKKFTGITPTQYIKKLRSAKTWEPGLKNLQPPGTLTIHIFARREWKFVYKFLNFCN